MAKYICKCCNYETDNQSNYLKHNKTVKHNKLLNKVPQKETETKETVTNINQFDNILLMEMINKQNEMIEKQNEKIKELENKIIMLMSEPKIKRSHSRAQASEPITKDKQEQEQNLEIEEEVDEEEVIRVNEKTLNKRKKDRKRKEKEITALETKKEKSKNKDQKIEITNNLIDNFKPINPPMKYMEQAIKFIRKLFKQQNIDIEDEFDETINSNDPDQVMFNYNEIQSLLTDNQNFFRDGCNLNYDLI